jgi:chromosome segregation protein
MFFKIVLNLPSSRKCTLIYMQLTKLEIKGFKSFGDRVVINFDKGITGIVGPNGCGKSNVVDAIRWVLGEQKTSALRSEKMENIIFNGAKNRKPTQLAEVSLSFNNTKNLLPTEYHTLTITRRYYRSGDSEYSLNGVTCRLKDITNLFLDTGIASNSYAIIELKMVDEILNDKDNSRRHLFEEAAGISKFKIRKKETLKKLSDTDADLERVEDLLFEIDKNMRSLERQAKQAERYYRIKEEYKAYSVELARKSLAQRRQDLEDLQKKIDQENDSKTNWQKLVAEKEAGIQKAKKELIQKEKVLATRQKSLNEHVSRIRHYESEKKIKNERLKYLNDKSDTLNEQIEQDRQSIQRTDFSLKSLKQEKDAAYKILMEIEARLESLKDDRNQQNIKTDQLQDEVNTLEQVFRNQKDELYQIQKAVEIKEIQQSSLRQELEKTATETTDHTASLEEFENKIKILSEEVEEKQNKLADHQQKEESLENTIISVQKTLEMFKEERSEVSRKLDAKQNEYNLTKSLVDNLEGFPEAIKFLKKQAQWNTKAPLLSDIITCDEKYRITIENYLERYMNYYIVDSEADAYKAINLLSDAAKGKAHFFVLSKFEKYKSSEPHLYDHATPATEVIEYDHKYRKLVSFILDDVYIIEGSEQHLPANSDSVFITQSGKVIKRKHSISGGSVGLFEGKRIGRAKNLEKLEKDIKKLNVHLDDLNRVIDEKANELENLKSKDNKELINEEKEGINLLNQELVSIKTKKEQFYDLLNNQSLKKEDITERLGELNATIEELKPQAEKVQSELEGRQQKLEDFKDELKGYKELLDIKSNAFNEENIRFHQQQNRINSLEQEISFKQSTLENNLERIEKNQSELKHSDEEIKKLLDSNEIEEDELLGMYNEKENIEKGVNEAEKEYYAARGNIDSIEQEVRELQHKREASDDLLMELNNKRNELKLDMSSVKERLSVEFNIDLDQLMLKRNDDEKQEEDQQKLADMSEMELKQMVEQSRQRLDKMGPINPMAMEAYHEIKERHGFITGQREDLVNAKESLMTTIGEIDTVARETFMEAYDKVKENFVKVFRSLFTEEDDCDLKLSDPENPLESSIEIMAKPKGKRPLTINQLSGGEKTLTATSLLFAIYLLKPAPFCIFDEVDAPLDDANIDKFNNIIKTFSEDSQFIIVTHNKRTMAGTDVIYGITMVEQGVSRVVPVDLRELA